MEEFIKSVCVEDLSNAQNTMFTVFRTLDTADISSLVPKAEMIHNTFLLNKSYEFIAQNLSLLAVLKYKTDKNNYKIAINMLEDAKFLAENSHNKNAIKTNLFCWGYIYNAEKNYSMALNVLKQARNINSSNEIINAKVSNLIVQIEKLNIENKDTQQSSGAEKPIVALLNVARTLAAETSLDHLLKTVAEEIKKVLDADRCTVFLLDRQKNELVSKVALGMGTQELRFPADKGLAGYAAQMGEIINIKDAYKDERFNSDIDKETGYKTKTILCMPIWNMKHEILGVFQVLNKNNDAFFTKEDEDILIAIGSSAGIAIENAKLFESQQMMIDQQKELFKNFVDTLAASIDARDKITAGHSNRVKMYSELICEVMNVDERTTANIIHAAILHDIGKIGIRDAVLQKDGKLTDDEYKHIQEHVKITYDILNRVYISEEFKEVAEIASSHHEKYDGTGYFRKLKGNDIPFGGRVLAVSDVFDAITSKRHYRDKMPIRNALDIIKSGAWKHFDGDIVEAFFKIKLDRLVDVFLSEVDSVLYDRKDRETLDKYDVDYLFNVLTNEQDCSDADRALIELFNTYYNCKAGK